MVKRNRQVNTVKSLQNDYYHETDSLLKAMKKQKKGFRRRIVAFGIIATLTLTMLLTTYIGQNKKLAEKEHMKKEVEQELQLAKDQQEMLKVQIDKLQDDEYIAKLARKEYFLSEEGEIIFTIPDEEK